MTKKQKIINIVSRFSYGEFTCDHVEKALHIYENTNDISKMYISKVLSRICKDGIIVFVGKYESQSRHKNWYCKN